jgi:hypothetical protein
VISYGPSRTPAVSAISVRLESRAFCRV